ncbi:hypothetical protein CARUB_v10018785mg [Capsella rubella]|uniref:C2H2-type domain-containing protein n=1 Tax=Capsella rubella TaxID=81985 RepID=R0HNG8_9BRAS|nr:zinc finger protein GIS [Capsella rubella]EOA25448.1 hypothetical protein CARUB_v10018785mg [Capsella rubella]
MDEATGETETQDFMNVESFSQLPFIRRPKDKNPKPIRVFGKDFTDGDLSGTTRQEYYPDPSQNKNKEEEDQTGDNDKDNTSISNNRRYECHYCFRNFPTSQALGGHQNAHKRERQLAKRGVSSYFHHPDTSLYTSYRHYPSWSSSPFTAARSYGRHFSSLQSSAYYTRRPSYGSPLGLWRRPRTSPSGLQSIYSSNATFTGSNFSSNSTLSLLAGSQPQPPLQLGGPRSHQIRTSSYRYGLSPNVQDHVSLDLHL